MTESNNITVIRLLLICVTLVAELVAIKVLYEQGVDHSIDLARSKKLYEKIKRISDPGNEFVPNSQKLSE